MQFFYTGATSFNAQQTDPNLSLGGYISGSLVPNDVNNNILSNLSWQSVKNKRTETRGLILKNTLGFDCTDVIFGYQYPSTVGTIYKLEVAAVLLNQNNPTQIERIPRSDASPIYAVFTEANINPDLSIDNSIDIGTLANNTAIGIWLRLSIQSGISMPNFSNVDDQIAWWKNISISDYNNLQTIQIKLKYSYNQ